MKVNSINKKILIITYYFPPSGGAGVQRSLKFVKYLRDFGWEPVVLTAKDADYPVYDESLWGDVPDNVKIYRSKILEPYRLYRKFTGRGTDIATDITTSTLDKKSQQKLSEKISAWVRAAFFVPDARILWSFFAVFLALKIARKEKISIIYSSAPPYTTHLIGLAVKRLTNLPWIADFRDSWIGWHTAPQWRPALSRKLETKMEGSVLKYADRILTVSSGVKADLISRHKSIAEKRWSILTNGYDEDDFLGIVPIRKENKLTITYTGSFFGEFSPEYLLRALEELNLEDKDLLKNLHLRFIGRKAEPILNRIKSSAVNHLIENIPYVPHKKSLAYLLGSDILLLIIDDAPNNCGILTGKLFEYIGAGHPILALAPEGDAAQLIKKNGLGVVIPPRNVEKIKNEIKDLINNYGKTKKGVQLNSKLRNQFKRKTLTSKLADLLEKTV